MLPVLYVQHRRNARTELLQSQLPDVFDTAGRVLRTGQSLTQALQTVADEHEPPVAAEPGRPGGRASAGKRPGPPG